MRTALLALALLLPSAPAWADRQTAEYFAARGEKALQAKDWAQAEDQYRRALAEDAGFHAARYGLAQALLGTGKAAPAVEELRKFLSDVKADPASPPAWKLLAGKAEKQLQELDASGAELQKFVDRYADDLIALARKLLAKDVATARRAARRALELRPGDKAAGEILLRLGESPKGPTVILFNGTDLKNWVKAEFPYFQVDGGFILGSVAVGSRGMRSDQPFEGDFDIRMEARILEELKGDVVMSMMLWCTDYYDSIALGVINRKAYFVDWTSEAAKRIIVKTAAGNLKVPFDPLDWSTYEMRFRRDEITALINGEVVGTDKRTDSRKKGYVGINVQCAKVAVRKVEVLPR